LTDSSEPVVSGPQNFQADAGAALPTREAGGRVDWQEQKTVIRRMWVAAVLAAVVTTTGCGKGAEKPGLPAQEGPAAMGVKAIAPATELNANVTRVTGSVRSKQEATLSAQATGTLAKMHVKVGDRVKKGQVLASLDTSNVAIGVEQARAMKAGADAALQLASNNLERVRKVAESGGVAAAGLDQAEIGQPPPRCAWRRRTCATCPSSRPSTASSPRG